MTKLRFIDVKPLSEMDTRALGKWIRGGIQHYRIASTYDGFHPFKSLFARAEGPVERLNEIYLAFKDENAEGRFLDALSWIISSADEREETGKGRQVLPVILRLARSIRDDDRLLEEIGRRFSAPGSLGQFPDLFFEALDTTLSLSTFKTAAPVLRALARSKHIQPVHIPNIIRGLANSEGGTRLVDNLRFFLQDNLLRTKLFSVSSEELMELTEDLSNVLDGKRALQLVLMKVGDAGLLSLFIPPPDDARYTQRTEQKQVQLRQELSERLANVRTIH